MKYLVLFLLLLGCTATVEQPTLPQETEQEPEVQQPAPEEARDLTTADAVFAAIDETLESLDQ